MSERRQLIADLCEARPRGDAGPAARVPIVAWFDFWVGAYWDRRNRRLYVLPLPCIGIVIAFGGRS